jgi:hypothetical protein
MQSDGSPVLAGYTDSSQRSFLAIRYDDKGVGSVLSDGFGYSPIKINGMAIAPNDRIVLAGYHSTVNPFSFFITVLSKDGTPEFFLPNASFFQEKINGIDENLHNITIGPNKEIVAIGYYENSATGEDQVLLRMQLSQSAVSLITGKGVGIQGDTILVPIRLKGCSDLYFTQGKVILDNPAVGQILGFTKNTIDVAFNGNAFSFFNSNGVKLTNDTLFFARIALSGNPGDSTIARIVAPSGSLIEVGCSTINLTPHTLVAGSVRILANLKVSGTLLDHLGKPVGKAVVILTGATKNNSPITFQMTTGASGTYLFDKVPVGSNIVITPHKDINPKNGVTAHDMFVGQRWLLNLHPAEFNSALQVLAGDANNNSLFST